MPGRWYTRSFRRFCTLAIPGRRAWTLPSRAACRPMATSYGEALRRRKTELSPDGDMESQVPLRAVRMIPIGLIQKILQNVHSAKMPVPEPFLGRSIEPAFRWYE